MTIKPVRLLPVVLILLYLAASPLCQGAYAVSGYTKASGYQYVQLGSYPQTAQGERKPILWRVLDVTDDYLYLFSEYVLFNHRVHEDYREYETIRDAFHLTELFGILNGVFLKDAFTDAEAELLFEDAALGKVFLVTSADLRNKDYGFTTNKARQGFGTEYAIKNGLFKYRNTAEARGSSPYWTRTPSGTLKSGVNCTKAAGNIGYIRCVVMNEGIRPAVRLLRSTILYGGGTVTDPYYLGR